MDPLWLSLVAIAVVIVGVLIVRLHPFLALSFGALVVAVFTPSAQLRDTAVIDEAIRVTEVDSLTLTLSGPVSVGPNLVYRSVEEEKHLQQVGTIELTADNESAHNALLASNGIPVREGDLLLHAAREPVVNAAAKASAGQRVAAGFGDTCRKIGILIAMASVIGMCLLESGAARRIVDTTRNLVGEKRTPIAFAISGFIVGIPVFFDTVFYLLMPLARAMREKTGGNYLLYVMSIVIGASMAHSLVPPTPGPLLVAAEIDGVDVGDMILGGLVVGAIAVTAGFFYSLLANRIWEIPLRHEGTMANGETSETSPSNANPPPLMLALTPILLPVVLLAGKTFCDSLGEAAPTWLVAIKPQIDFLGDKNIALIIAAAIALVMLALQRKGSRLGDRLSGVQQALSSGGVIILITAAGGAFGQALRQCGIADAIQGRFPSTEDSIVLLGLAFVVTAVVRFAQGSATVAMITGVSIVAPIASNLTLSFHPVYLALAIGCGSKPLPWMNDSGFWIVGRMSGMTESETLKTFSVTLTIMGVVGFLVTLAGARWLPLVAG